MPNHPNKEIRAALTYAARKGWSVIKSAKGHCWGIIRCPYGRGGCQWSVWSTPRNPENHAQFLRRCVDRCPHQQAEEEP